MGKGCTKVGAVDIGLSGRLWKEESMTPWTKDIDSVISGQIGQPHGQDWLSLTKDVGAPTEMRQSILFVHGVHATVRNNVPVVLTASTESDNAGINKEQRTERE